jgi:N6-adenosine-specific RNA methylase IME4
MGTRLVGKPKDGRRKALTPTQRQRRWRDGLKKQAAQALHITKLAQLQARADAAAATAAVATDEVTGRLFAVIVADPPWHFQTYSPKGMSRHAARHYPTMTTDAICQIGLPAAPDCVLFIWVPVWASIPEVAFRVIAAWGFTKVSAHYWQKLDKQGRPGARGHGYWSTEGQVEELWVCRRGHIVAPHPGTQMPQSIAAPKGRHSEKPQVFYDHIVRLYPNVERLEMFARPPLRPGFWSWGDEVPGKLAPPVDEGDGLTGCAIPGAAGAPDRPGPPSFLARTDLPPPKGVLRLRLATYRPH